MKKFTKKLIIFIILLILSTLIYVSYNQYQSLKDENNLYKDINLSSDNALDEGTLTLLSSLIEKKQTSDAENVLKWIFWGGSVALIILVLFLLLGGDIDSSPKHVKQPVEVDRVKELLVQNLIKRYNLPWVSIDGKNKELSDKSVIEFNDQRVYYHNTGERFLIIDFIVNDGKWAGFHSANIPIDKGEKSILSGEYNISHGKSIESYEVHPQKFPIASGQDKKERSDLLFLDQMKRNNENDNNAKIQEARLKQDQALAIERGRNSGFGGDLGTQSLGFDNPSDDLSGIDNPLDDSNQAPTTGWSRYGRRKKKKPATKRFG